MPCIFCGLYELEKFQISRADNAFKHKLFEIHDAVPEFAPEQQNRHFLDLARLDKRQQLKNSSKVPNPPGKTATARARSKKCILRNAK